MTARRMAAYLGGASLVGAWLASAAGIMQSDQVTPEAPRPVQTAGTETLAADVQAQAQRLRQRLAAAPAPQEPFRNPFTFAPRPSARPKRAQPAPEPLPSVASVPAVPDPLLTLVGIAEDRSANGPVRTAMIGTEQGELLMLKIGDVVKGHYRVESVSTDTVELTDLVTGTVRRLTLR